MLQEKAKEYYLSGYNCAEAILHAARDTYGLPLEQDTMKIASGFGKGMFSLSTCGAVTASIMTISLLTGRKDPSEAMSAAKWVKQFQKEVHERLDTLQCATILEQNKQQERSCVSIVIITAEVLENTIKQIQNN